MHNLNITSCIFDSIIKINYFFSFLLWYILLLIELKRKDIIYVKINLTYVFSVFFFFFGLVNYFVF